MLPGRIGALFQRTLAGEATLALQTEIDSESALQFFSRTSISCHLVTF
jgi:hypothetical protein